MKYFISIVISIIAIVIAIGFFFVGTPAQERLRRFDDTRVQDLSILQSQIIEFWQAKNRLPNELGELTDATRGIEPRQDPETGATYEYAKTGDLSFRLCADFRTSATSTDQFGVKKSAPVPYYPGYGGVFGDNNWNHGTGRVCFERVIDPDFFKPNPAPAVKQ